RNVRLMGLSMDGPAAYLWALCPTNTVNLVFGLSSGYILTRWGSSTEGSAVIDQISTVIAALSLIALAFQVAYSRWEWLYLTVNRLRYALFNPSSRWDLTVEYGGSFQRSQVEA